MPKQSQRKSFIIALLCLALVSCGKHKKEESGEVSKGSLSSRALGLTDQGGSEDQNKEKQDNGTGGEGEEETGTQPSGTIVKDLTPAEIVQTQLDYGTQFVETPAKDGENKKEIKGTQFQGEFKERKKDEKDSDQKNDKENQNDQSGLIVNPFFQNQVLADAFNAVSNSHVVELINLEKFEKSKQDEIIDNYFTLLNNPDVTNYPLEKRFSDNLNLYSTNPTYAAAVSKKLNMDLSKILAANEIAVFEPLALNTKISAAITGYPKPENGLGTYYIDNKEKEQEYTAIFIGQFIPENVKAKKFSLTNEEKKNLDQIALLLKTYFESPIKKPQDKLHIVRHTTVADADSGITTVVYAYLQEKWPAITSFTKTVGDDFNYIDPTNNMPVNRVEILIENSTSNYAATIDEFIGTTGGTGRKLSNPNAGKKKFDTEKVEEKNEIKDEDKDKTIKQDVKKDNKEDVKEEAASEDEFDQNNLLNKNPLFVSSEETKEETTTSSQESSEKYKELQDFLKDPLTYKTTSSKTNEEGSKVEVASAENLNSSTKEDQVSTETKQDEDEPLNLNKEPEFIDDWDDQSEVEVNEALVDENELEEVKYFANPFQKDPANKILKATFFAYEGTGADYNGLDFVNLVETDEITPAQQQQVVDEYLRLMKEKDPIEFLNELPLSERLTNTFDLYNFIPAFRDAVRDQVENQIYDIENKNNFKLTESELNIVVPLLYCFKINREISMDRFQKEISSQDEFDVYETINPKTKQKTRVIRLARFDFSEGDKTTLSTKEKNVAKNLEKVWTSVQNSAFASSWTGLHPVIAGYSNKNIVTLDSESEQDQEILAMAQSVKKSLPKVLSFDVESRGTVNPLPGTKSIEKINRRVEIVLLRTEVK